MEELNVNINLYLKLKKGETKEDAKDRLYCILMDIQKKEKDFCISDFWKSELQES